MTCARDEPTFCSRLALYGLLVSLRPNRPTVYTVFEMFLSADSLFVIIMPL